MRYLRSEDGEDGAGPGPEATHRGSPEEGAPHWTAAGLFPDRVLECFLHSLKSAPEPQLRSGPATAPTRCGRLVCSGFPTSPGSSLGQPPSAPAARAVQSPSTPRLCSGPGSSPDTLRPLRIAPLSAAARPSVPSDRLTHPPRGRSPLPPLTAAPLPAAVPGALEAAPPAPQRRPLLPQELSGLPTELPLHRPGRGPRARAHSGGLGLRRTSASRSAPPPQPTPRPARLRPAQTPPLPRPEPPPRGLLAPPPGLGPALGPHPTNFGPALSRAPQPGQGPAPPPALHSPPTPSPLASPCGFSAPLPGLLHEMPILPRLCTVQGPVPPALCPSAPNLHY